MKSLDQEINSVKTEILNNFVEVFYNNELKNFITLNSKFIRSKIAILYFKTLGYEINDQIYKVLAIGEIIHCASLLHDDVLDEAEMRRGQKTLSKEFSSKVSILAGDYLLTHAIDKIQSLNNAQIMNLFNICTKNMIKAEINQYFLRKKIPDLESYLNICKGKTADLFSTILMSCSVILNSNISQAKSFGEKIGLFFQLKNDIEETSALNDMKNDIYTIKDILGVEKSAILLDNYKKDIREFLNNLPDNIIRRELEDLIICL